MDKQTEIIKKINTIKAGALIIIIYVYGISIEQA